MEVTMKNSSFKFSKPEMIESNFSANDEFNNADDSISLSVAINNRSTTISDNKATVQLRIKIGSKDNDQPFELTTIFQSTASWTPEIAADETLITNFLEKNMILLLLSYARPAISTIINFSKYPSYDLPFIDLSASD